MLDPVDGSTNCRARHRLLGDVAVRARRRRACSPRSSRTTRPGEFFTAIRGQGAFRDGQRLKRLAGEAGRERDGGALGLAGAPAAVASVPGARLRVALAVRRSRPAASTATSTAARGTRRGTTSAAYLMCREAGASVVDADDQELVTRAIAAPPSAARRRHTRAAREPARVGGPAMKPADLDRAARDRARRGAGRRRGRAPRSSARRAKCARRRRATG